MARSQHASARAGAGGGRSGGAESCTGVATSDVPRRRRGVARAGSHPNPNHHQGQWLHRDAQVTLVRTSGRSWRAWPRARGLRVHEIACPVSRCGAAPGPGVDGRGGGDGESDRGAVDDCWARGIGHTDGRELACTGGGQRGLGLGLSKRAGGCMDGLSTLCAELGPAGGQETQGAGEGRHPKLVASRGSQGIQSLPARRRAGPSQPRRHAPAAKMPASTGLPEGEAAHARTVEGLSLPLPPICTVVVGPSGALGRAARRPPEARSRPPLAPASAARVAVPALLTLQLPPLTHKVSFPLPPAPPHCPACRHAQGGSMAPRACFSPRWRRRSCKGAHLPAHWEWGHAVWAPRQPLVHGGPPCTPASPCAPQRPRWLSGAFREGEATCYYAGVSLRRGGPTNRCDAPPNITTPWTLAHTGLCV